MCCVAGSEKRAGGSEFRLDAVRRRRDQANEFNCERRPRCRHAAALFAQLPKHADARALNYESSRVADDHPVPGTSCDGIRCRNSRGVTPEIGRAHVWTPVTNAHLVCRLLLEKKNYT